MAVVTIVLPFQPQIGENKRKGNSSDFDERLVFEQEKGPVVQWLSCIIISRNAISKVHKICVQKPETSHGTLLQYTRVNIPCYHVCTGLNPKNLFETLKSYYYNFVVHVPLNIFKTQ